MSDRAGRPTEQNALFGAYCDGVITDEDFRALETILLHDEAARREFVAYFHLHTELRFSARARRSVASALRKIAAAPRPRWQNRWAWLAAAATVLLAVIGFAVVRRPAGPAGVRAPVLVETSPEDVLHSASGLATVTSLEGIAWDLADGPAPAEGNIRGAGRLRFRAGRVVLAFFSGVTLTVEGPADLDLVTADRVFVRRGKLRARVPHGAEGFAVASHGSAVIDLGTEFALNVETDGRSRVMVFEGAAEVALLNAEGSPKQTQLVERSEAFDLDPRAGRIVQADARPEAFVSASVPAVPLLVLDPAYPAEVMRARPMAYWRFESGPGSLTRNEVAGGPPLRAHGAVARGDGPAHAVFRAGAAEQYLTTDGLWELPHTPGHAVECWFLPDVYSHASLVGLFPPEPNTRYAHVFFVELTARERQSLNKPASVRFLRRWPIAIKGGNNVYSEGVYTPGRWHHVVAQKNGDRMELYLDGTLSDAMPLAPDHPTSSCHLVVGRRTTNPHDPEDVRPFVGRLDELALYDHPLSAEEIHRHFRLASVKEHLHEEEGAGDGTAPRAAAE